MAGQYGFSFDMSGDVLTELRKVQAELKKMQSSYQAAAETVKHGNEEMAQSFKEVGEAFLAAFAVERVIEFGKEILHVTAEFQGFDNVIKFASRNTIDANENLSFLHQTITDLKLPMEQATKGFSEMQAGLMGTGIEGEKLRNFFKGFSTMATVQHLDPARYDRALYDLKEIGEIGLNKRMERSLIINLTGIGKVVKETFGKTMHELQEEGMSGTEFLDKLGAGMQKSFAPGLENARHSLQAEMAATQNSMTQAMLDMGKNLEPVFIEIMHSIQDAFNSAPVQWFIANIKDIVQVVGRLAEVWLIYKGIILATDLITKTFAVDNGILTVSMGGLTVMTDGATLAVEGLGTAFDAIGIGVIALGIAGIVSAFNDLNKQIDNATEKYTHFQQLTQKQKSFREAYEQVNTEMHGTLDKTEKNEVFNEIATNMKNVTDNINKSLNPSIQAATNHLKDFAAPLPRLKGESDVDYGTRIENRQREFLQTKDQLAGLQAQLRDQNRQLANYSAFKNSLTKQGANGKIKYDDLSGVGANASNSSDLSGAKGGLNEAKQIHITIGTVQRIDKVEAGSEWNKASEIAGEQIIREINNLSLSQSSTF